MLGMNKYEKSYIDGCRRLIDQQLAAYDKLLAAARRAAGANKGSLDTAITGFEHAFCHQLILALDRYFVHRIRAIEKKDGNALNEVRMLCTSITEADGTLQADNTIKYDAAKSVLKLAIGDAIVVSIDDLRRLVDAFFKEIRVKFG